MDRETDGQTDGWTDGPTGQRDKKIVSLTCSFLPAHVFTCLAKLHKHVEFQHVSTKMMVSRKSQFGFPTFTVSYERYMALV